VASAARRAAGIFLLRVAAGLALSTAKPMALSRRRRKSSGIGVPERVHFTEF